MREGVPWILALMDVQPRLVLHTKNCQQRIVRPELRHFFQWQSTYPTAWRPISGFRFRYTKCQKIFKTFVSTRVAHLLILYSAGLLSNSQFLSQVEYICQEFDRKTKLDFRNTTDDQRIRFGNPRDRDIACGIQSGQLKLAGYAF